MKAYVLLSNQKNKAGLEFNAHAKNWENHNADEDWKLAQPITNDLSNKLHWTDREINNHIKEMKGGDLLIVYHPADLTRSTSQVLDILNILLCRNVIINFLKYNAVLDSKTNIVDTLGLVSSIESDFVSKRTTEALAKRKAAGLSLGRPRGARSHSLKLDKFANEIKEKLEIGISKASIAKLIGCHPQTLYDWLKRKGVN